MGDGFAAGRAGLRQFRLDLAPSRRKIADGLIRDADDLKRPILVKAVEREAYGLKSCRQRRMIDGASRHFPVAQDRRVQRADRSIGTWRKIEDDAMGVEIWIGKHPAIRMQCRTTFSMLKARSGQRHVFDAGTVTSAPRPAGLLLQEPQCLSSGTSVGSPRGLLFASVADKAGQRHRLRRRRGHIEGARSVGAAATISDNIRATL